MGTHRLRNLLPETITEVDPGPNYTLGPPFNDAEIPPGVKEEHVLLVPSLDPRGQHGDTSVTNLLPETITEVDPGPNYTLGTPFNDAEIPLG